MYMERHRKDRHPSLNERALSMMKATTRAWSVAFQPFADRFLTNSESDTWTGTIKNHKQIHVEPTVR